MTRLDHERTRYRRVLPEERKDLGVRFRQHEGGWALSIPKNVDWVLKEGYAIPVTKRNGSVTNVRLKEKISENEHGQLWSFKKYGEGAVSPLNGP